MSGGQWQESEFKADLIKNPAIRYLYKKCENGI